MLAMVIVAALSALINRLERPVGAAFPDEWVRTVDGWEPRRVLIREAPAVSRQVHPGLVAAFQAGASALALIAFPARVAIVRAPAERTGAIRRKRAIVAAASR